MADDKLEVAMCGCCECEDAVGGYFPFDANWLAEIVYLCEICVNSPIMFAMKPGCKLSNEDVLLALASIGNIIRKDIAKLATKSDAAS